ncbi:MAG: hypothetical protein OXH08_13640 [Gammaproteobacteria bacterium]|nr:hypothetical protein [Gammaproteobacteria bacterium]MDE0649645.1 hypothetical protein [Gammaproteobacteria bacterium]
MTGENWLSALLTRMDGDDWKALFWVVFIGAGIVFAWLAYFSAAVESGERGPGMTALVVVGVIVTMLAGWFLIAAFLAGL